MLLALRLLSNREEVCLMRQHQVWREDAIERWHPFPHNVVLSCFTSSRQVVVLARDSCASAPNSYMPQFTSQMKTERFQQLMQEAIFLHVQEVLLHVFKIQHQRDEWPKDAAALGNAAGGSRNWFDPTRPFRGYYDKLQFDPTGRYVLGMESDLS